MNRFFPEIKKNFGFGCMRFPTVGDQVDTDAVSRMVDAFLAAGFNYFDTARPYHGGASEQVVRQCLTSRYPRERFVLTDKLSYNFFQTEEDIRPLFEDQLRICGVDYFDFYLIHANSAQRYPKYRDTHAFEILQQLKAEGKIRHIGMSFHDTADVLDQILSEHPELDVVQLQINYADWLDPKVQGQACRDVCRKHGKPVIIMEPVKGGSLANLPQRANAYLRTGSAASYALRFAAGQENICMTLSGMSSMEQMMDNLSFMSEFRPLDAAEMQDLAQILRIYQAANRIPCTGCRYCTEVCPAGVGIPELMACMNDRKEHPAEAAADYSAVPVKPEGCLECGRCETICPQHLQIRDLLKEISAAFGA